MDASHPACQMALIGKARLCGNLGKAEFPIPNHFDRPSQSQMNDAAIVSERLRQVPKTVSSAGFFASSLH